MTKSVFDDVLKEESQPHKQHIWFLPPTIQTQKTKRAYFFCPRSDGLTRKRTKCILKNEINGNFGLF